jgi:hypothetical protein
MKNSCVRMPVIVLLVILSFSACDLFKGPEGSQGEPAMQM